MQENSITLTADQRDAYRIDAELKQHAQTVVEQMIEIGRCLKEMNERRLYQYLDTATFAEYAEKAVGLKERAAYNYITAYETYGEGGLKKYGELGITKLVALAQLNDADRTEMLESGTAAELSSRELEKKIKELKGENDQLRFELDDSQTSAKNNAEQIAALKKQLEEAQRPVVASMTDEEKDEIRREAEKKARMDAEAEMLKFKTEMRKQNTENLEKAHTEADKVIEKLKKEHEKALKEQDKTNSEQAGRIAELTSQLEAATTANAELQARAEKKEKPVLAGSKEALKFCLEDIQNQFTRSVELVGTMEGDEKAKFKAALISITEKLRAAAEGIV